MFKTTLFAGLVGGAAAGASCAQSTQSTGSGWTGTTGASGSSSGGLYGGGGQSGGLYAGDGGIQSLPNGGMSHDFPSAPILDTNAPSNAAMLFGDANAGSPTGGPCVYEPTLGQGNSPGSLFPNNWLRPIFEWTPMPGQDLFEIRMSSPAEVGELVVYTPNKYWKMTKDVWTGLTANAYGVPVTVTLRGMKMNGGMAAKGTTGTFAVAPAQASGAMVFWSTQSFDTNSATTALSGFQIGDEGTTVALTPNQVQQPVLASPGDGGNLPMTPVPVICIGCHTSTPDGNFVGFTAQWPWPNAIASVAADAGTPIGAAPPWLAAGALDNLSPNIGRFYNGGSHITADNNVDNVMLGIQTFSAGHYAAGDRIEVTSVGASKDQPQINGVLESVQASNVVSQLIWIDLEWNGTSDAGRPTAAPGAVSNGGWGVLARTGDSYSAGAPSFSHKGDFIAYTSANGGTMDGRLDIPLSGDANVRVIPYANKAGGTSELLMGASDSMYNEYFPSWSPDDTLIAFNRVAAGVTMYNEKTAEVFLTQSSGGAPVRLAANDPPACTGTTSPGVQNTWAKWAPGPSMGADGKTYYWVTFSSTRSPDATGHAQLYMSAVVKDGMGAITTYPAVYLWNQDNTKYNLIPSWDKFTIPHGMTQSPPPR